MKPDDPLLARARAIVIGSNRTALEAAQAEARRRGYAVRIEDEPLSGAASLCASRFVARLPVAADRPTCVLAGGETVVQIGGNAGLGGRSQEFALAAALELPGTDWTLLAAGTDGIDGPTPAAGAFCDGRTVERAGRSRARAALAGHDSHRFFAELGDLLTTGPTGTNVMDLVIALHTGKLAGASPSR